MNQVQTLSPYYHVPSMISPVVPNTIIIAGTPGEPGPPGEPGTCSCYPESTYVTSEDYICSLDDYYIGLVNNDPIKVWLPEEPSNGKQIIIKYELGNPAGQRITTVLTLDGSLIDGASSHRIKAPHRMLHVLFRNNQWHIIGKI